MLSFLSLFQQLTIACVVAVITAGVSAAPLNPNLVARKANAVPAAPHFVTYSDRTGPPDASQIEGFNVYVFSFLLSSGPADQALAWTQLSADQRTSIKASYAAAGIKIMVSAFGSTDQPTTSGQDPVQLADTMAAFVKQYDFDGIDVDYEDFTAFNGGTTAAVDWLASFTRELRSQLGSDSIITHAPVAPWFEKGYSGGGYLAVHQAVGSMIDWYNIQFYNQGTLYQDCTSLITTSGGQFPGTSVLEISSNGVPLDKLVIGKPAQATDATNGAEFIDPATLATCVSQAASSGWNAGVMTWEFPDGDAAWIKTVRGSTFPE